MQNIKVNFQVNERHLLLALKYIQQIDPEYKPKSHNQLIKNFIEVATINYKYKVSTKDQQIITDLLTEKPKQIISLDDFIKQQNLSI